jgi:hypothetical protein
VKGKRTQQQGVDDAEASGGSADADSQRGNHENSVKRMARPKPECIPSIVQHSAHHLNWDRDKSGWVKFDQPPVKSN